MDAELPDLDTRADDLLTLRDTHARFLRALDTMPAQHRRAWSLTHEDGLSIVEAARVLRTTGTAVKLRVHRAARSLREALSCPPQ
jgi:RNA polymerase sigma-70 factor (ECF subfamily)